MLNILKSLWQGKIPLRRAFWVYGVLLLAIIGFCFLMAMGILIMHFRETPHISVFIVHLLLFLWIYGYGFIACIGIFRSAKAYQGSDLWQLLAIVFVIYTLIIMINGILDFSNTWGNLESRIVRELFL